VDEIQKTPADFPRQPAPGSVSGVQPKLLVVKVDNLFISETDEDEIYRRWLVCEDLVQQLVSKTVKRMREGRVADLDDYVNKLQQWLEAQEWDGWKVTWPEARWMGDRIKALVEAEKDAK
jgi:hypothetical protein